MASMLAGILQPFLSLELVCNEKNTMTLAMLSIVSGAGRACRAPHVSVDYKRDSAVYTVKLGKTKSNYIEL